MRKKEKSNNGNVPAVKRTPSPRTTILSVMDRAIGPLYLKDTGTIDWEAELTPKKTN